MINVDSIYLRDDIAKKKESIGSVFREKLCFDGTKNLTKSQ